MGWRCDHGCLSPCCSRPDRGKGNLAYIRDFCSQFTTTIPGLRWLLLLLVLMLMKILLLRLLPPFEVSQPNHPRIYHFRQRLQLGAGGGGAGQQQWPLSAVQLEYGGSATVKQSDSLIPHAVIVHFFAASQRLLPARHAAH